MLQPGEGFPAEASAAISSDISTQTSGPTLASGLADLAPPAIAGIVLGVLGICCVILAIILTIYLRYRGRSCSKPLETSIPSSSCQTTTPNTTSEHGHESNLYQISNQTPVQASDQTSYLSPCSPQSYYGLFGSPNFPFGQIPVEIYSNCPHELPVSGLEELRTSR
jgi:hypothetical protein